MTSLLAINWLALLEVAGVTIAATALIGALMSAANWFFTPEEGLDEALPAKRILGWVMLVAMGAILAFGIWLIVPYFHLKS